MKQSNTPSLPFSDSLQVGELLYISGQVGVDAATGALANASFGDEVKQVMENLGRVLRQYHLDYRALISVTIYLTDMGNYAETNAIYRSYFATTYPTRVCIAVKQLPLQATIEIAAIAQLSAGSRRPAIPYYHVDVFSPEPFKGNGLIVFPETAGFDTTTMLTLTREMRQFESIFLGALDGNRVRAHIYSCEEEMNFAGHPVLGAAATLHDLYRRDEDVVDWTFELNVKTVTVTTEKKDGRYEAAMNQGKAAFGRVLNDAETRSILAFIDAVPEDLYPGLYPTVVSTGLPYLIIPFRHRFFDVRVGARGLEEVLYHFGAQCIGLLDVKGRRIRTGLNDGSSEDIATGSLAGPACAFLVNHGLAQPDTVVRFDQGSNLHRKSELFAEWRICVDGSRDVLVSGSVCKIARGVLEAHKPR